MTEVTKKLLIEKYRPSEFSEFVSGPNNEFVKYVFDIVVNSPFNLPNLLLYGSAGCGKTTFARLIADRLNADYLYINASDENGVDVIRGKVNNFACTMSKNKNSPKIVFMDESDRLTSAAQDALKQIIEDRNEQCRFIFACNNLAGMTEPIKSRCNVYNMLGADKMSIRERINFIVHSEHLDVSDEDITNLIESYYPDIRSMINNLDNVKFLGEVACNNNNIVTEFVAAIESGAHDYKRLFKLVSDRTLNHRSLLIQIFNDLSEDKKLEFVEIFAEADLNMSIGATPEISMAWFTKKIFG